MRFLIVKKQRAGISLRFLIIKKRKACVFRIPVSDERGTPNTGAPHSKENAPPPRTLLQYHAYGPVVVLEGWLFLMSEVPL